MLGLLVRREERGREVLGEEREGGKQIIRKEKGSQYTRWEASDTPRGCHSSCTSSVPYYLVQLVTYVLLPYPSHLPKTLGETLLITHTQVIAIMAMYFIHPKDLEKHKEELDEDEAEPVVVEETSGSSGSPPPPLSILLSSTVKYVSSPPSHI